MNRVPTPSARARIVGWSMLLVATAIAVSVVVSGQVLLAQADARLSDELTHEGVKLRSYAAAAVDPRTGEAFTTGAGLLTGFLRDNLPDRAETFFSVVGGRADRRSPTPPLARLDTDPAVVALAAAATKPLSRTVSTSAGPALIGIFPVRIAGDETSTALVAVEFLGPARAEAWTLIRLLAAIGFAAWAIAGLVAWLVAGRVLRPVREVRRTAERIGESDLTSRITVTGNDDVAQLARTFNRMLDRVQAAFTAQQDFLNDVGHELRTPLTIIRGHVELMADDPSERAHSMPLVLDEIDRMRRLVDDLTTLAQADRPDFVRRGPVDLTDLIVDLAAKAAAIAPRRWHIDAVPEGRVSADGQRLTQALMQLCSNAVHHTGDGDTVAVGGAVADGQVRLWVRDTGCGIPEAEQERIFTRTARGRNAPPGVGSGLGLAIVSAIAEAHGGTAAVDSTAGFGSTFTLNLPLVSASDRRDGPAGPHMSAATDETAASDETAATDETEGTPCPRS